MGVDNTTNNNYNKQEVRKKLKNESKYLNPIKINY